MAKMIFDRTNPHLKVATFGRKGGGKTMLAAAIRNVMWERYGLAKPITYEELSPQNYVVNDISLNCRILDYASPNRDYTHYDFDTEEDLKKALISGAVHIDVAIGVVPYNDILPYGVEMLLRQVGIQNVIFFITHRGDEDYDEDMELVAEETVIEDFECYDFFDCPIVVGDALLAYEHPETEWAYSILELVECLDDVFQPERLDEQPFMMPVDDTFSIVQRGTIATGKIARGVIGVNQLVEIVGFGETKKTVVTGVEIYKKIVEAAQTGDRVGLLLRGINRSEIMKGQVIAAPGTIHQHSKFNAFVYSFTEKEGGIDIYNGNTSECYIDNVPTLARIGYDEEIIHPGQTVEVTIDLLEPRALEIGTHFVFKKMGQAVLVGTVTELFD